MLAVPNVSRTVLSLGLTSFFTDISSEMVSTILPLYLVFFLRLSPLQFGIVDGLYQGASALVRVAAGFLADRWRRQKELAAAGYALSAVCKLGLLAAGHAWTALAVVVLIDRTGKGIRTAPRDAMISLSSARSGLATAFGVHRAMDTAGAMIGPLVAFAMLSRLPNGFDAIFVASFCAALMGLGVITLFVEPPAEAAAEARPVPLAAQAAPLPISVRAALGLLESPRYRALVVAGGALGLATMSDGFLYLGLQRRLAFNAGFFPLLYVATSLFYFLLALPMGRLADRVGRGRVLLAGYGLLLPVYLTLLLPSVGYAALLGCLVLFGAYYASTDGVLMALASATLAPRLRTTGLGLLTSVTSVARLFASVLFGAIWTAWGVQTAVPVFAFGLVAALALAAIVLVRAPEEPTWAAAGATVGAHS